MRAPIVAVAVAVLVLWAAACAGAPAARSREEPVTCTRTVSPDDSLQELLESIDDGAVICLTPGKHAGRILLRRSVTLRGQGAGVILDGEGRGPVLKADAGELTVVVENLTITGGAARGGGGAVAWNKQSDLILRDVVLTGNRAPDFGGGAIEASLGSVRLERCRVEDNRAPIGAAILAHTWVKLTLADSLIAGNVGERSVLAISDGAEVTIERSTIAGGAVEAVIDVAGGNDGAPAVRIIDSILLASSGLTLANDEGAPGRVTLERTIVDGDAAVVAGLGDYTRAAGEAFTGDGVVRGAARLDEGFRPGEGSPAIGLAKVPPDGTDLEGKPRRRAAAGALEP